MADPQLADARLQGCDETLLNAALNQGAAAGGAALAVEAVDHEHDGIERALEVGVVEDDHRVLAAELEMQPLQRRRRLGHDVLARTVYGSRAALQVVALATTLSLCVGVPLGLVSGYFGGRVDRAFLFLMDTIYTLPGLLLSVTLAFVVGRGVLNAAIALSISYVPQYFRVVRNHTTSIKTEPFIEAAQAMGASPARILWKYLFLNVIQSVPVLFTLNACLLYTSDAADD